MYIHAYARFRPHTIGAGRVSAEVARDLSKMHGVTTMAIDHREKVSAQDMVDFENGGNGYGYAVLKKSYTNWLKELAKDASHLPQFASAEAEAHYMGMFMEVALMIAVRMLHVANTLACTATRISCAVETPQNHANSHLS